MAKEETENLKVVQTDVEAINEKIRQHRQKRMRITLITVIVAAALIAIYVVAVTNKTFSQYNILTQVDRSDTDATHFMKYSDGLLKYSNDGISYVTYENDITWNIGYEMQSPMVASCDKYCAVVDNNGEDLYIMDTSGLKSQITVNRPVVRMDVAGNGNVAILMEEGSDSYLSVYDSSGKQLADGAVHSENGNIPLDLAISEDGENLAVASADISTGDVGGTLTFYNFEAAGNNQDDNIVAEFKFDNAVIPSITYAGGNSLIAFADNGVHVYTAGNSPQESASLSCDGEIYSVFYNKKYIGLSFASNTDNVGREIHIYNMACEEQAVLNTDMSYDDVSFLDNNEICLTSDNHFDLYTIKGRLKYSGDTDEGVRAIFHRRFLRDYVILLDHETQLVRFRLIDHSN